MQTRRATILGKARIIMNIDFNIFEGRTVKGIANATIAAGKLVWSDGELRAERGAGRYLARKAFAPYFEANSKRRGLRLRPSAPEETR